MTETKKEYQTTNKHKTGSGKMKRGVQTTKNLVS